MADKIFTEGMWPKRNDNAPEFVVVNLSIEVDKFVAFLRQHETDGKVKLQVLRSKKGKLYCEVDQFEGRQEQAPPPPPPPPAPQAPPPPPDDQGDVPF